MKYIQLILFILILTGQTGIAQFVSPFTSTAGSKEMKAGNIRMSVSIGNVMHTATIPQNQPQLTYGALSSSRLIKGKVEEKHSEINVKLHAYPNPVVNLVHVNIKHAEKTEGHHYQIEVYNMFGQRMLSKTHHWSGASGRVKLRMRDMQAGQYFIRLTDIKKGKTVARLKVIKGM